MNESCSDFEIRTSTVEEFKTLEERPSVFTHDVSSESASSTTLPSDRVNQNAFSLLYGFFDEVKNSVTSLILGVENDLVVLVKPVKC